MRTKFLFCSGSSSGAARGTPRLTAPPQSRGRSRALRPALTPAEIEVVRRPFRRAAERIGQAEERGGIVELPLLHVDQGRGVDGHGAAGEAERVLRRDPVSYTHLFLIENSPILYSAGNPDLKPAITQTLEFGYEYQMCIRDSLTPVRSSVAEDGPKAFPRADRRNAGRGWRPEADQRRSRSKTKVFDVVL